MGSATRTWSASSTNARATAYRKSRWPRPWVEEGAAMGIEIPGKRWGKRLRHSKVFGHGAHAKKATYADLLITPLVDMFVIIVLFLIANFSATGEVLNMTHDIQLPEAFNVQEIEMAPVVMVSN